MKLPQILIIGLVLIILLFLGVSFYGYNSLNSATTHDKANTDIKITKGESPSAIISKLSNDGIIKSPTIASLYARLTGLGAKFKAGDYRFPSPITTMQVFEKLQEGEEKTTRLTILEGWTRWDIAKAIVEKFPNNNGQPNTEQALLELMNDISLVKDIDPLAKNLEGYLFPSTYNFPKDATPKLIVKTMVDQFRKEFKGDWIAQAQVLGKTTRDIVTIASLIENESKVEAERAKVASVIYNRLQKGMPLGIDAVNIYDAKLLGKWDGVLNKSDLERDSPYNVRIKAGLPPSPISSPSASALKAALNPEKTDYLFYVLDPNANGAHTFQSSAGDFERAKAVCKAAGKC